MKRVGPVTISTDLCDVHLYIFDREAVTAALEGAPEMTSVKAELLPALVQRQFCTPELLKAITTGDAAALLSFPLPPLPSRPSYYLPFCFPSLILFLYAFSFSLLFPFTPYCPCPCLPIPPFSFFPSYTSSSFSISIYLPCLSSCLTSSCNLRPPILSHLPTIASFPFISSFLLLFPHPSALPVEVGLRQH